MAAKEGEVTFDSIIQRDRQKAANELLAAQIFGRVKSSRGSQSRSVSLGTRHGISKTQSPRLTHHPPPSSTSRTQGNGSRSTHGRRSRSRRGSGRHAADSISIKGMGSSSCILICQNFALGTTAADIEAVLAPDPQQGVLSCRLVSSKPTVAAELVFASREEAQRVVDKFNNKRADGRVINVYIRPSKQTPSHPAQPATSDRVHDHPQGASDAPYDPYQERMDIDDDSNPQPRRAMAIVQDGRYGFADNSAPNYWQRNNYNHRYGREYRTSFSHFHNDGA